MEEERTITLKQAKKDAAEMFGISGAAEMGWTMKEYISDYLNALKEDGYKIVKH